MMSFEENMYYLADNLDRDEIYKKIASDAEKLAKFARKLVGMSKDDLTHHDVYQSFCDKIHEISGDMDILEIKNGWSLDSIDCSRTSPILIEKWVNDVARESHD